MRRFLYFFLLAGLVTVSVAMSLASLRNAVARNRGFLALNRVQVAIESTGRPNEELTRRSIAYLEQATETNQDDATAWWALGYLHRVQGAENEMMAAWEHIGDVDSDVLLWAGRAERVGNLSEAGDWYRIAVRLEPQNGDYWYKLAGVSAQIADADARNYYLRALSAPERTEYGRSNILTRLAELAKREAQPDWAVVLARYDDAIRQDDFVDAHDIIRARQGRAEALDRLGQFRAALDAYRWLADYQPGHYWANLHSGRLVWQVEQDVVKAVAYLEKAIEIDDEPKWAYLNLGLVYAQSGKSDSAIPLFRKVLKLDPDDTSARTQLDRLTSDDES